MCPGRADRIRPGTSMTAPGNLAVRATIFGLAGQDWTTGRSLRSPPAHLARLLTAQS
jgi:hypothetical protein